MVNVFISIVIPAYNEERRIPVAIRSIHTYLTAQRARFEILVVDDGSHDRTATVVNTLAQELPTVHLIQLSHNQGKGGAVREGVLRANGDFILFTDADQSTSIEHLPTLLAPLREQGCQLAIASRSITGAQLLHRQAWYRQTLGKLFGALARVLLIRGVTDTQCGFKCLTREAAKTIFSQLTCRNGLFDMEVLLLAARHGYRVAEVPVRWVHDPDSRLVYNVWGALGLFFELLRIRREWGVGWPERVHLVQVRPEESASYQEQDYRVREVDLYAATKYDVILEWLSKRSCQRVLNVGCGSGELNILLARRGYAVEALDPSAAAVSLAKQRLAESETQNVSIHQIGLFEFAPSAPFDAIICMDVLEHIGDDGRAVQRLAQLLAPDGLLFLSVPTLEFLYGYHDEQLGHYRRYSRSRLLKVLDSHMKVQRLRYFGFLLIPVALLYSKILRRPYPVEQSQRPLIRRLLAFERRWPLPLGTSMLVEAQKADGALEPSVDRGDLRPSHALSA